MNDVAVGDVVEIPNGKILTITHISFYVLGVVRYATECQDVALVKSALYDASRHQLKRDKKAGIGIAALALRNRLQSGQSRWCFDAREWFGRVHFGDEPAIGPEDNDFEFVFDAEIVIDDEQLKLWRVETDASLFPSKKAAPLFEVVSIKDCV